MCIRDRIETVDMGAFEAMEAMGSTKVRAFISSIVPQVLPSYLSNCLFCFEGNAGSYTHLDVYKRQPS